MRSIVALVSLAGLAACQPAGDAPASGAEPSPVANSAPADAPASLVGEYRVAGIDGTEVGGGIGIAVSVTADRIGYDPRCAGFEWTYAYDRGALATDRPGKPGPRLTAGPQRPVCEIAVHPELQRLATALDAVTRAERTPSNGIELSGDGHSVTLYSQ